MIKKKEMGLLQNLENVFATALFGITDDDAAVPDDGVFAAAEAAVADDDEGCGAD